MAGILLTLLTALAGAASATVWRTACRADDGTRANRERIIRVEADLEHVSEMLARIELKLDRVLEDTAK